MRGTHTTPPVQPTMFPFLSVLVCMIGALMLIASAIAPRSLVSAKSNTILELEVGSYQKRGVPIVLECRTDTARSLDSTHVFTYKVEEEALMKEKWKGTPFTDFLNDICQSATPDKKEYVLFVVRPEGLGIFNRLRSIIVYRNRAKCRNSVSISEQPDKKRDTLLPPNVTHAMRYSDGVMSYLGVMTTAARDTIKWLFTRDAAKDAIDRLFEKTQAADSCWVDYGTELVPSDWRFEIRERTVETQPSAPVQKGPSS